jgi:hypothetical protein
MACTVFCGRAGNADTNHCGIAIASTTSNATDQPEAWLTEPQSLLLRRRSGRYLRGLGEREKGENVTW